MATSLAQVLRHFGAVYLRAHALKPAQARAWRAIVACRTPVLGGQRYDCDGCGAQQWRYHSCRNRHCPQCQSRAREAWRVARLHELLNVPYCHLVFTLPHELNALAGPQARWVYETLLQATAATLNAFAANPRWLGAQGSFTLVLHTWTQDLRRHLHVHALMACGGLSTDSKGQAQWQAPRRGERFLFPVHALSKTFKAHFLAALQQAQSQGDLPHDPCDARQRQARLQALQRHAWVVYAKTPMAGPAQVLDYLSRYTHRTAISNERLVDIQGDQVRLRVRGPSGTGGSGPRIISLPGVEFIQRFLQHVLPAGFKRIRHYGLLSPANKRARLALARQCLHMPAANPLAQEQAQDFMRRVAQIDIERCPHCAQGRWRLATQVSADREAYAALWPQGCRGPP